MAVYEKTTKQYRVVVGDRLMLEMEYGKIEELWSCFEKCGDLKNTILEYFSYEGLVEIQDLRVKQIKLEKIDKDSYGGKFTIFADVEFKGKFEVYNEELNIFLEEYDLEPIKFVAFLKISLTFEVEVYAVIVAGNLVYKDYSYCIMDVLSVERIV